MAHQDHRAAFFTNSGLNGYGVVGEGIQGQVDCGRGQSALCQRQARFGPARLVDPGAMDKDDVRNGKHGEGLLKLCQGHGWANSDVDSIFRLWTGVDLRWRRPFRIWSIRPVKSHDHENVALVLKAFDTLFNQRDYAGALAYWSDKYVQHSAHVPAGRNGLFDLVKNAPADMRYENGRAIAQDDMVWLHGRFTNVGQPANWIVVDICRVENGQLVEHWDVIQDEATRASSAGGHPMFGDTFPS